MGLSAVNILTKTFAVVIGVLFVHSVPNFRLKPMGLSAVNILTKTFAVVNGVLFVHSVPNFRLKSMGLSAVKMKYFRFSTNLFSC